MHKGKNLAQLIYRMSRGVVPAGIHPFDAEAEKLVAEGMKEELARKLTDLRELLFNQENHVREVVDLCQFFLT